VIIVTGAAGFIGSAMIWKLNKMGYKNIIAVDNLDTTDKWKNLVPLQFIDLITTEDFLTNLETGKLSPNNVDSIIHLGADTSTTNKDCFYIFMDNYYYTKRLMEWHDIHVSCRMIYASSAATYGNPPQGQFIDNPNNLQTLRPLTEYAYSKHLLDLNNYRKRRFDRVVGLKFFNVFGPNEYHKGDMSSKIYRTYQDFLNNESINLFYNLSDNTSKLERDFIYVKDVVEIIAYILERPIINGLFNVGTGESNSWFKIVSYVAEAMNIPINDIKVRKVLIPKELYNRYQYYTKSDNTNLNDILPDDYTFTPLKNAIFDYVKNYLIIRGNGEPDVLGNR